jgi:hypothetical protein
MPEPSTPPATEAIAQTRVGTNEKSWKTERHYPANGVRYCIGEGVCRARSVVPYERAAEDPVYRPLRVFTVDPTVSQLEGATAVLNVPYEPVERGPSGAVLEVLGVVGEVEVSRVNLEDGKVLISSGLAPSTTNHLFHQQMVYAVVSSVYAAFRLALGRVPGWGFAGKLQIRPHVPDLVNAYYDQATRSLNFGFYQAGKAKAGIPPNSRVYTCLSHDIIVHELTHALLDGLRSHFTIPTCPDVLGFHEGFADLVAIFQRFTYQEVVRKQIERNGSRLEHAQLLTGIAQEFGYTTSGSDRPLRTAIDSQETPLIYGESQDPYKIGSTLLSAMFEAFTTIYQRRIRRYCRLAGASTQSGHALNTELVDVLAEQATKLASHILTICIRALDYCPPIDLQLGEYLRALITADHDLVPDDKWAYRETFIRAFARRKIYPAGVPNLSEDALLWRTPQMPMPPVDELCFAKLKFAGDPASPANEQELNRQACELAEFVTHPDRMAAFGLAQPGKFLPESVVDLPCVQSIRTSRRVGPAGQVIFDLVAEITQRRTVRDQETGLLTDFYGGVTLIIGPEGNIRYTVLKRTDDHKRLRAQVAFQKQSKELWIQISGCFVAARDLFLSLHEQPQEPWGNRGT